MKVLILGGTSESRALAAELDRLPEFDAVTSLAGRVANPVLPAGNVRTGGFGGADALALWLRDNEIDAVVDATHPFAAAISDNAARAAEASGIPLVVFAREPWHVGPGDRWVHVPTLPDAAAAVQPGARVFLTIGRQGVHHFAGVDHAWFLVRAIDPPEGALPPNMELVQSRGPFTIAQETAVMTRHAIDVVITKNSGGSMTEAKLTAARRLDVPVIMVDRPPAGPAPRVYDVAAVLDRLRALR